MACTLKDGKIRRVETGGDAAPEVAGDAMTRTIAAIGILVALFGTPAVAGSPDDPGAGGRFLSGLAEGGADFGQGTADIAQGGNAPGQGLETQKDALGGSPNPSNDNGGGND